jgi:uncharacterized membrane protein YhhN
MVGTFLIVLRLSFYLRLSRTLSVPVLVGFIMAFMGDYLMNLPSDSFLLGLVFFLVSYIVMSVAFLRYNTAQSKKILIVPFVICLSLSTMATLFQFLFLLTIPKDLVVIIYLYGLAQSFILGSSIYAVILWFKDIPHITIFPSLAMILLYVSDDVISINLFYKPLPYKGEFIIMITYYIALLMLVAFFGIPNKEKKNV